MAGHNAIMMDVDDDAPYQHLMADVAALGARYAKAKTPRAPHSKADRERAKALRMPAVGGRSDGRRSESSGLGEMSEEGKGKGEGEEDEDQEEVLSGSGSGGESEIGSDGDVGEDLGDLMEDLGDLDDGFLRECHSLGATGQDMMGLVMAGIGGKDLLGGDMDDMSDWDDESEMISDDDFGDLDVIGPTPGAAGPGVGVSGSSKGGPRVEAAGVGGGTAPAAGDVLIESATGMGFGKPTTWNRFRRSGLLGGLPGRKLHGGNHAHGRERGQAMEMQEPEQAQHQATPVAGQPISSPPPKHAGMQAAATVRPGMTIPPTAQLQAPAAPPARRQQPLQPPQAVQHPQVVQLDVDVDEDDEFIELSPGAPLPPGRLGQLYAALAANRALSGYLRDQVASKVESEMDKNYQHQQAIKRQPQRLDALMKGGHSRGRQVKPRRVGTTATFAIHGQVPDPNDDTVHLHEHFHQHNLPSSYDRIRWPTRLKEMLRRGVKAEIHAHLTQIAIQQSSTPQDGQGSRPGDLCDLTARFAEIQAVEPESEEGARTAAAFTDDQWQRVSMSHVKERSAVDCKVFWLHVLRPDSPWTGDEMRRLHALVRELGTNQWSAIATRLGTGRTPVQCLKAWCKARPTTEPTIVGEQGAVDTTASHKREKQLWTPEDDEKLKALVEELGTNWVGISQRFAGKFDRHQLRDRWHGQAKLQNRKQGRWTEEEDEKLIRAISELGERWSKVSDEVGTRTSQQCRERYVNVLKPDVNKKPWSDEEVDALRAAYDALITETGQPKQWSKVAACLPGRTPKMCMRAWYQLQSTGMVNTATAVSQPAAATKAARKTASTSAGTGKKKAAKTPAGVKQAAGKRKRKQHASSDEDLMYEDDDEVTEEEEKEMVDDDDEDTDDLELIDQRKEDVPANAKRTGKVGRRKNQGMADEGVLAKNRGRRGASGQGRKGRLVSDQEGMVEPNQGVVQSEQGVLEGVQDETDMPAAAPALASASQGGSRKRGAGAVTSNNRGATQGSTRRGRAAGDKEQPQVVLPSSQPDVLASQVQSLTEIRQQTVDASAGDEGPRPKRQRRAPRRLAETAAFDLASPQQDEEPPGTGHQQQVRPQRH